MNQCVHPTEGARSWVFPVAMACYQFSIPHPYEMHLRYQNERSTPTLSQVLTPSILLLQVTSAITAAAVITWASTAAAAVTFVFIAGVTSTSTTMLLPPVALLLQLSAKIGEKRGVWVREWNLCAWSLLYCPHGVTWHEQLPVLRKLTKPTANLCTCYAFPYARVCLRVSACVRARTLILAATLLSWPFLSCLLRSVTLSSLSLKGSHLQTSTDTIQGMQATAVGTELRSMIGCSLLEHDQCGGHTPSRATRRNPQHVPRRNMEGWNGVKLK